MPVPSWEAWPENARGIFQGFRSEAGEELVLEKNIFVERVLPGSVMRGLSAAEMAVYRAPFEAEGEARRLTLTWPRQIPIAGEPVEVVDIAANYAAFMAQSGTLVVCGDAGDALGDSLYEARLFVRGSVKSLGADCIEKEMRPEHLDLLADLLERAGAAISPATRRRA